MRYALPAPGGRTRTVALRGLGFFGAVSAATDLFTMPEIQFLANEWPSIRVAANWTDIGWKGLGYPSGPPLSANSNAIMQAVWGNVRRAAKFTDINWGATTIPANLLPATAPVAAPVAVTITPNYNGSPLNSAEYATISGVWPTIRGAANWKDISWPALNYPNGPGLSAAADSAMGQAWGTIRAARWFQDINWAATNLHPAAQAVPEITKAPPPSESPPQRMQTPETAPNAIAPTADTPAAQPVPEIGVPGPTGVAVSGPTTIPNWWESLFGTQAPAAAQPVPDILAPGSADSTTPVATAAKQAGLFSGLPSWVVPAIGAVLFISLMQGANKTRRSMNKKRVRRAR